MVEYQIPYYDNVGIQGRQAYRSPYEIQASPRLISSRVLDPLEVPNRGIEGPIHLEEAPVIHSAIPNYSPSPVLINDPLHYQPVLTMPSSIEKVSYVHTPEHYIEEQLVHRPVIRGRDYLVETKEPDSVIRKIHKIPKPKEVQIPPLPLEYTTVRGFKYPFAYRIGAPKVRPPTEIQEEIEVINPPVQHIATQHYVDYEPTIMHQPRTRIVTSPVHEIQEIVPPPDYVNTYPLTFNNYANQY